MGNVGFREFLNFERPAPELVELFRGIPSPNVDDNMNRLYAMSNGMRAYNKAPLLGVAFTVKTPSGDNLMFNHALDVAQPGDIIVVDSAACMERALCGEIMVQYAISRKLGGFVINGCIRDIDAIAQLPFPVYALGHTPNGPLKNGAGEIGVPVVAGGLVVMPGDILVGDQDGITVVRPADAREVAAKARKQNEGEAGILADISKMNREGIWKAVAAKGCDMQSSYNG